MAGAVTTFYVLDEHGEPKAEPDARVWGRWFESANRHVAQDLDEGDGDKHIRVSTVFLGIDYNFSGKGRPVLWETLVFGGLLDGEMQRYASRESALLGHQAMCARVTATLAKAKTTP